MSTVLQGRRVKRMSWSAQAAVDFCKAEQERIRLKVVDNDVPVDAIVVGLWPDDANGIALIVESLTFPVHTGTDQEIPVLPATLFQKISIDTIDHFKARIDYVIAEEYLEDVTIELLNDLYAALTEKRTC